MLHNSSADFYPMLAVKTHDVWQVRFNIVKREMTDEQETRTVWDYEYAETPERDYGAFVDAIIGTHYSKDAEIALINKAISDPADPDYAAYNAFRDTAKATAKAALDA